MLNTKNNNKIGKR